MKRIVLISAILCAVILYSCEQKTHIYPSKGSASCEILFELEEFDVYVTPETDIVPIEYSRFWPTPEGFVDDGSRRIMESNDSEARCGTHYMAENWGYNSFNIYFEPGEIKGQYLGLHILPEKIDRNMKLILHNNPCRDNKLIINLIVDKENSKNFK